ncbi:TATA-box-binding protein [Halobacterium salinarum]|uniref:Homolog to TATA-binding transcription initiationfactor n=3 Tax=Halobacterium salinarum NRC-34001 TaxID=2886895 RepID=O51971_HALSA|nr:TATA-box-binding protein [Halobacterium salinarum]AAC82815.1 TbpA [Halobacterium salinarum NRC-1]MDL0130450.1 TATA-box-binding protein [Halobacterium salinarum]CAP15049.1 homolog to TATA-binding transcription initiation factor [Halobacterium salinarum R1]DAC79504.1 TPA_inf: homolog to TATA-binding transcription initiationfactor [Halobacterium salinarum NRC-1]DAC79707.1 TPA_inf: homolog to TATA-binding transcription initiationfactor [Halobacterium salinarum NRC-1]
MEDPKDTITIENVVASTAIEQELDLSRVAMDLEGADYDPEQFPGLVYRLDEPSVVALLFGSGKLVITGGKHPVDAEHAVDTIDSRLEDLGLLDGYGDRAK